MLQRQGRREGADYSVTIQPAAAAVPTTLFDDDVDYMIVLDDPSLVEEGFCRFCSLVARASVDARAVSE